MQAIFDVSRDKTLLSTKIQHFLIIRKGHLTGELPHIFHCLHLVVSLPRALLSAHDSLEPWSAHTAELYTLADSITKETPGLQLHIAYAQDGLITLLKQEPKASDVKLSLLTQKVSILGISHKQAKQVMLSVQRVYFKSVVMYRGQETTGERREGQALTC